MSWLPTQGLLGPRGISGSADALSPTYIPLGKTFIVPLNQQLIILNVVNDGTIILEGDLVVLD
jgi:hypothetical protein